MSKDSLSRDNGVSVTFAADRSPVEVCAELYRSADEAGCAIVTDVTPGTRAGIIALVILQKP